MSDRPLYAQNFLLQDHLKAVVIPKRYIIKFIVITTPVVLQKRATRQDRASRLCDLLNDFNMATTTSSVVTIEQLRTQQTTENEASTSQPATSTRQQPVGRITKQNVRATAFSGPDVTSYNVSAEQLVLKLVPKKKKKSRKV